MADVIGRNVEGILHIERCANGIISIWVSFPDGTKIPEELLTIQELRSTIRMGPETRRYGDSLVIKQVAAGTYEPLKLKMISFSFYTMCGWKEIVVTVRGLGRALSNL